MNAQNATRVAYAQSRGDRLIEALICVKPGVLAGVAIAVIVNSTPAVAIELASAGAVVAVLMAFFRPRAIDCSLCDTTLAAAAGRCPGCAAAIRGRR